MRYSTAAFLTTIGALAAGGPALADDPQRDTINATANAIYDSNVAETSAAGALARGIRPQDWVFQPGISGEVTLPIGSDELFFKGSANYDFYVRNSQLNGQTIDLRGGWNARLRDCRTTLAAELNDSRTQLQDLALTVTKNTEDTEIVRVDANCGRSIGFGPSLSVVQQWSNNSAPQLFTSDFRTITVTTGIAYRRPTLGELSLFGSYSQTDFPQRNLLVGPASTQDGYRDYSVGVRLEHRLGSRIEGEVRIAYTTLDPYVSGVQGYSGLDVEGDVSVRFSGRLDGRFTIKRAPTPTIVSNSTYDLTTKYSAEADYKVSPRVSLKLVGSQEADRYNGNAIVPGLDIQRENIWTVTGTSNFQLSRRVAISLWVSYQSTSTDLAVYDYDDERVGLSLALAI